MTVRWRSIRSVGLFGLITLGCSRAFGPSGFDTPQSNPQATSYSVDVQPLLVEALRDEALGDLTQATSKLARALAVTPNDWRTLMALARVHWSRGHSSEVREFGSRARVAFERESATRVHLVRASPEVWTFQWLGADWLGLLRKGDTQFWVWSRTAGRRCLGIDLESEVELVDDSMRLVLRAGVGQLSSFDLTRLRADSVWRVPDPSRASYTLSPNTHWWVQGSRNGVKLRSLDGQGGELQLSGPASALSGPPCVLPPEWPPESCPVVEPHVQFSPDRQQLLLYHSNGLRQFALPSGRLISEWPIRAFGAHYRRDGKALLVTSRDQPGGFYRIDTIDGELVRVTTNSQPKLAWLGNDIVLAKVDDRVSLNRLQGSTLVEKWSTLVAGSTTSAHELEVSPDARTIAVPADDEVVLLAGADGRVAARIRQFRWQPRFDQFSPDSGELQVCGHQRCYAWSLSGGTGRSLPRAPRGFPTIERSSVDVLVVAESAHAMLVKDANKGFEVWDTQTMKPIHTLPSDVAWAWMSRDARLLASGDWSGRVSVLNRATNVETTRVVPALQDMWATSLEQNERGRVLLAMAHNELIRVVDLETNQTVIEIAGLVGHFGELAPDAKWLAVSVDEAGVDLFSTSSGKRVGSFDFLDDAALEATARMDPTGDWQFSGRDAESLRNEYFCKFGKVYAPRELCE